MTRTRELSVMVALLVIGMASINSSATAGVIRLTADAATGFTIEVKDANGNNTQAPIVGLMPGQAGGGLQVEEVKLADKSQDKGKTFKVKKKFRGKDKTYDLKLKPGEVNLASLEPFNVPNFDDVGTPVFAAYTIELNDFLDSGITFQVGDLLSVTDGFLAATNTILFTDEGGSPFTGSVEVFSPDRVLAVPEPSTIVMAILGGLGLVGVLKRRRAV